MDPLSAASKTAASGLEAQSLRMRTVAENLANVESTAKTPGGSPFQRKTVEFAAEIDRLSGATLVQVDRIRPDPAPFRTEFRPGHPAANAAGYVKLPNVNLIVEMADMREANRSYEANLQVVKQVREMLSMTIDLLRTQT
jgi:flagellar basal-body rod protein FlgC